MAVDRAKWRNLTDLYVEGEVVPLKGDLQVWLQPLNPFEQDEARNKARAARARVLAALSDDSEEMELAVTDYLAGGRDTCIGRLVGERYGEYLLAATNELESDPDWAERLELVQRGDEIATPASEEEKAAVDRANADYVKAINDAIERDSKHQREIYEAFDDESLRQEVRVRYRERRSNEVVAAEYQLQELYLATRVCDATQRDDGTWEHHLPAEERVRVWDSADEVRVQPRELLLTLRRAMDKLNMSQREAKDSEARVSSSDSSPLSKQEEESTPSTQDETPAELLGSSTSPSPTP